MSKKNDCQKNVNRVFYLKYLTKIKLEHPTDTLSPHIAVAVKSCAICGQNKTFVGKTLVEQLWEIPICEDPSDFSVIPIANNFF